MHPSTGAAGCSVAPGLVVKMWPPGELILMSTPWYLHPQVLVLRLSAISCASPWRPSKTSRYVWPMLPWSHCFFPGSWCTWPECALWVRSLHFPSSVACLQSSPAGLQRQMLWGLFLLVLDLTGCGAWLGALNSDSCRRTSAIYYSPVCGHVPGGWEERSGMWLYYKHTPATISLWVLPYVFGCWLSFLFVCLSPVFLISGCSAVSWDFSVLMKGGELEVIPLHHLVQEAVAWHLIIKQMKNFIETICSAIPVFGNIFLFFFPKGSYFSPKCCWECSLLWLFWILHEYKMRA